MAAVGTFTLSRPRNLRCQHFLGRAALGDVLVSGALGMANPVPRNNQRQCRPLNL